MNVEWLSCSSSPCFPNVVVHLTSAVEVVGHLLQRIAIDLFQIRDKTVIRNRISRRARALPPVLAGTNDLSRQISLGGIFSLLTFLCQGRRVPTCNHPSALYRRRVKNTSPWIQRCGVFSTERPGCLSAAKTTIPIRAVLIRAVAMALAGQSVVHFARNNFFKDVMNVARESCA